MMVLVLDIETTAQPPQHRKHHNVRAVHNLRKGRYRTAYAKTLDEEDKLAKARALRYCDKEEVGNMREKKVKKD